MRKLILLLFIGSAFGQSFSGRSSGDVFILPPYRFCLGEDNGQALCFIQFGNQITRTNGSIDSQIPTATVSTLPSASANASRFRIVTDGQSSSDCAVGGGSTRALCMSDSANWVSIGSGVVSSGTASQFAVYQSQSSVQSDTHLDDGLTTPNVITSSLPIAATQFQATGGTGGFVGYGSGGALPVVPAQQAGWGVNSAFHLVFSDNASAWGPLVAFSGGTGVSSPTAHTLAVGEGSSPFTFIGPGTSGQCLLSNGAADPSFQTCPSSASSALSAISAAVGTNTIGSGNNPQIWNWAQTSDAQSGFKFGESAAATNGTLTNGVANQAELTASTASGSTATPLSVVQGSVTGTNSTPAMQVTTTWNNASLTGEGLLIGITDTASLGGSLALDIQRPLGSSQFSVDKAGDVILNAGDAIGGNSVGANISYCGGLVASTACISSNNATLGGAIFQGGDASGTGSGVKAGFAILRGGMLTNAAPNAAALEGTTEIGYGYLKGSALAATGDVVCGTTTAFTVTDCSHTGPAVNIIGIATNTANPIGVVAEGTVPVATDGAVTIGHILCMGTTTDGQAHDNGTAACATAGTTIGVVIATSGSVRTMQGASQGLTALSTTLPLVQLHIGK